MKKNKRKSPSKFHKLFDPRMFLYDFVKWTGSIPPLIDLRAKRVFINKKNANIRKGSYILAPNHLSITDPVVISTALYDRRIRFVCLKELTSIKFWGKFFKAVGCIPIDREKPSIKTFKEIKHTIDMGHIICMFPEGHIEQEDKIQEYKSGIIMASHFSNTTIIPVYIVKREKWYKRQIVIFGERFNPKDYISNPIPTVADMEYVSKILKTKELELENYYKENIKK